MMNDRLIKESDVLKAIDKRIEELSKHPEFVRKNGHIDVIGVKKHILAIPSADRPQEWIPCSERLPEETGRYLCTVGAPYRNPREMYYAPQEWADKTDNATWRSTDGNYVFDWFVEAWQPLPEPWKGADDERL